MKTSESLSKLIRISAWLTIAGILFSGPLGLFISNLVQAQPSWENAEVFILHYHPIQRLTFLFGFIMILGFVMFISAIGQLADNQVKKVYSGMAIIFAAVYVVIIGLNYTLQVAYIPAVMHLNPEVAGMLTMVNPMSVSWVLEMFGYAFLGLSVWFLVPLLEGSKRTGTIRVLMILNGIVSILGAIITVFNISWVLSTAGLISYLVWNLLILIIMVLVILEFKPAPDN